MNRPFTVPCLVAWPLNNSEAGGDLVLIETSLLFSIVDDAVLMLISRNFLIVNNLIPY